MRVKLGDVCERGTSNLKLSDVSEKNVQQEHRHHAEKKARNAQNLHRAREVQAAAQVVDLRAGDFRGVLEVLLLERAHQLGVRQKTVGVGQQNQRDGL